MLTKTSKSQPETSPSSVAPSRSPNSPTKNILECHHLSKIFDHKKIVDDVSFSIPRGKIVGLLGQNGAGKSTLIKLFNDLLVPTSGEIRIDGQPIGVHTKSVVSYLPEQTYLDQTSRIADVIKTFTIFYEDFDLEKAKNLLDDFELNQNLRISKMSKGMQEKLQLTLVMSRKAKLFILDEPLDGIDPATQSHILNTILSNFDNDASMLISTHLIADVEQILDTVLFMSEGKIILEASADKLRTKHHSSIDAIFRKTFKHYPPKDNSKPSKTNS